MSVVTDLGVDLLAAFVAAITVSPIISIIDVVCLGGSCGCYDMKTNIHVN